MSVIYNLIFFLDFLFDIEILDLRFKILNKCRNSKIIN